MDTLSFILCIVLAVIILIIVGVVSVVLYQFMHLVGELNKRQLYVITDILGNIDLSTPHLDTLNPNNTNEDLQDFMNDINDSNQTPFNPHDYEVDSMDE